VAKKAKLIHVSACLANGKKMAEAFNSQYFLAPDVEVDWVDAAIFSMLFYKLYIVDGVSFDRAFNNAKRRTKTASCYPQYWE
jgi:hypothetical protein